ncbi:MAG TPA: PAS domain-containing protein, partial [Coleofasciculaceae cyanobacterium]
MFISPVSRSARKVLRKLPLRLVLTLPFVVQTVGVVTLVGYLSYRSGQQAVADLARQLMQEKGDRIVHNLEHYFKDPKTLLREHQAAIKLGILNWQNTSLMQTYFTQQLKIHTDVGGLMISTQRKDFLAVGRPHPNQFVIRQRNLETGALENYTADLQGNRLYLRDNLPNYDPHADPPTNPWYTAAKKSKEGFWQLVVSLVRGKDHPILMMAYFLPFADSQGKFQGVLSSSVYLDRAGTFLRRLQIGKTGQAFIMDEKGLLIATSTTESPFRWERSIKPKETLPPEVLRLAAQDSQNPVTRTAAAWSVNQRDSLNNDSYLRGFRLHNQQYFGRVIPFQLDDHIRWTIVVVVPESDFMAQIQANIYRTMLLCGLALLGSIGSGIWTSKRITRSLFRLTQATQTVAAGTLDVPLPSTRILEVENLTASFRQMVRTLQEANQLRQNYAQDLERQVAEKTALLNEALQVAKIGSWSWNLVSDERWWSPQMYQILGLNPDEYSTPPDVEITNQNIHPEDRERVNQITRDAIKQGISYNIEFRFLHSDGSIIYVFSRGLVEHDSEGTITRFWGITQDISDAYRQATQRQATEIALQESELKFATIFQDSPQPAWIATLAEGRCLEVNESFCRFLGHSHAEAIGKTCVEVQLWNDLADLHHFRKTLLQTGSIQDFEVVFRTRAGEAKTVLLAARVSRLNDQDCVIGVLSDISSRKLAEIALKQSETRFLEISESSPANIYIIVRRVDGSFYFEHMSRAIETIHELSVEQVLENANILLDRIHPEDRASYEAAVNVSIETLQPFQHEWRVINPSGKIKWLQGSSRPKRRDNGEIAWYGIVIDISDRKQAEIALQQNEARF